MSVVQSSLLFPWNTNPLSRDDIERITEYFDEHKVEQFFVKMLILVGKERPECPYTFMTKYMEECGYSASTKQNLLERESAGMQSFVQEWQNTETPTSSHTPSSQGARKQVRSQSCILDGIKSCSSKVVQNIFSDAECRASSSTVSTRARSSDVSSASSVDSVLSWDYDVFAASDEDLMRNAYRMLTSEGYDMCSKLDLNDDFLRNYIATVSSNYRSENSYHNFKHAFSVMSAVGILLREGGQAFCDPVQTLAALISGLTHDIGHPGQNNDYFVKTGHQLAIRYNDQAVLENMHAALTFEIMLMPNHDVVSSLSGDEYVNFRKTAIDCILNTDMKAHFDLVSQLQANIKEGVKCDPENATHRKLYQNCLVHAGDLSNPVLPTNLCKQWAYKVVVEFHSQAQLEHKAGIPSMPFMEHHPDNTLEFSKLQIGFCSFVVKPFWDNLTTFFEESPCRVAQLDENLRYWQKIKAEAELSGEDAAAEK